MPGIYGLSNQDKAKTSALTAMSDAMLLYPHFLQDELFSDQHVAASRVHLGKINLNDRPDLGDDGNRTWIEGEVYNLPEVLRYFGWSGFATDNQAFPHWLLHAYQSEKLDMFLNRLDGDFCASIYDPARKKLLLVSDRFGMRLLYWYHHNGLFAWAGEVKGILAIKVSDRAIDPTALNCFMDLGYLMGEHTWFEHIRLIKPATVIEYDLTSDQVSQRFYWTWGEIQPSNLPFDDAVDALYHTFIESVRRRFDPNERIGISLSGGLDSRAIFAAVNQLYPDIEGYAYTFGSPNSDDISIAKQVVARSNWRHDVFFLTSDNWFKPRKEVVWNTDGMLDILHMHGGEFLERIGENIDVNLHGYCGDVVAGGGWIGKFPEGFRASNKALQKAYGAYGVLGALEDEYFDINDVEPGLYASRVRRFTNMGVVGSLVMIEQRKPFFGNQVIEWAYAVPSYYRAGNRVYSEMLQRYFPKFFKDIPWQKTGQPAGVISVGSNRIASRAIRKLLRILKSDTRTKNTKEFTDYPSWIRSPSVATELRRLLNPIDSRYSELTSQNWQTEYLVPHLRSVLTDKSNQILRAATIEYYLRKVHENCSND
jgi:asparagine synthase (glutamine-hydrolysing)